MKADSVVSAIIALIVGSVNTIAFFVFLCDILCDSRRRLKRLPILVDASSDGRPCRAAAGARMWEMVSLHSGLGVAATAREHHTKALTIGYLRGIILEGRWSFAPIQRNIIAATLWLHGLLSDTVCTLL